MQEFYESGINDYNESMVCISALENKGEAIELSQKLQTQQTLAQHVAAPFSS